MIGMIGSALSAAGSIYGGIKASQAMKGVKSDIEAQRARNSNLYNLRMNENATQRADAQALLNRVEESIRRRNRQAAGVQAVTGGSEESVAAAKEANNQALSQAASTITANAEARKDQIEQAYLDRDAQYANQLNQMEAGKAQAVTQAVSGLADAAGNMDFGQIKVGKDKEGKDKVIPL